MILPIDESRMACIPEKLSVSGNNLVRSPLTNFHGGSIHRRKTTSIRPVPHYSHRTHTLPMTPIDQLRRLLAFLAMPFVFAFSMLIPRDEDRWVFMAGDDGERFADNAKYLFLACAERDVRCLWITSSEATRDALTDAGYECYLANTRAGRWAMFRAGVFFETHGPVWPHYTGRAAIVHLTHGNYLKQMLADHSRDWPWILKVAVEIFFGRRRKHTVTGPGVPATNTKSMHEIEDDDLLVTGFPRNDVLFEEIPGERLGLNEAELDQFLEQANAGPVLLYAPTWRQAYGGQNGIPLADQDLPMAELDEVLDASNAHLYVSPHPATTFDEELSQRSNISLLDSGGDLYPFMRECDALITDYSGIFYDYLLLDRPMIFFAPDLEAYLEDRPLYFDYEDHVPGQVAQIGRAHV